MASRIEDYALIGDCQTVALVARDGSMDWLCLPRFDSGACFAALLGTPDNGRWQITPASPIRSVQRRYRGNTLILETQYTTDDGMVTVIDLMPPRTQAADLVRIVRGERGTVRMRCELVIRFDYGSVVPWVHKIAHGKGLRATAGPDTLYLYTDVPLRGEKMRTVGEFTVSAGQSVAFELAWCPTYEAEPPPRIPLRVVDDTERWWQNWSARCTYQGEWAGPVLRSLITLKALTYAPTGGIVAAATTSLPEQLGGVRNWDYRYCWLRDATFTLYALMDSGYIQEAKAWRQWLVNAAAGTPEDLQIMYGLAGERRLSELELPWLAGYGQSRPVRIGNAAYHQHQLDVYGEVMDAMQLARRRGLPESIEAWRIQQAIIGFLEEGWKEPDNGIWEVRGPRHHFTHSKVMAWVAMDRAVKAVEQFHLPGDMAKWGRIRDQVHQQVCREGFDPKLNSFVQYYGSKDPDASLLLLPSVGFLPATDSRMVGTTRYIQKQLVKDGFVQRYPAQAGVDGLPPGEGAFMLCTFWLADALAMEGQMDEAREIFEHLLSLRNDVGLLAEEYDPQTRRLIGNFPQAFSHVGLINTARNLSQAKGPSEDRRQQ
jgi:GH15 family glucan-1,4-alpha-glucosidase